MQHYTAGPELRMDAGSLRRRDRRALRVSGIPRSEASLGSLSLYFPALQPLLIFWQNDEKRVRQNTKSTVISQDNARIMSYADIVEVQRRRTAKTDTNKAKPPIKRKQKAAFKSSTREIQTQQLEGLFPP